MSNLGKEMANRGSKLCMQICVNNTSDDYWRDKLVRLSRKNLLDKAIGLGTIEWLSPLAEDSFREYELRDLAKKEPQKMRLENMDWSFWANSRHPQWDAIGIAQDGSLVLVEAKANVDEIKTDLSASDPYSQERIASTINRELGENEKWLSEYYQIANRLVFLKKVSEYYGSARKVYCVFLYFANDVTLDGTTRRKATKDEWKKIIDSIHKEVSIPVDLEKNVKEIILDIWKDSGVDAK